MKYHSQLGLLIVFIWGMLITRPVLSAPSQQQPALGSREWRTYPMPAPVTALAAHGDTLWAGTTQSLVQFNRTDGTSVPFTTAEGLIDNSISAVTIDPDGNPWVGTWNGNISRFDGQQWQTHLPGQPVNDLTIDPASAIWAAGGGITRLTLPAPAERVWLGTTNGVSLFDGGQWQNFTTADGLVDNEVRAIAIDPQGRKWFGTANGVSAFDGRQWANYAPLTSSLVSNFVQTVAVDPANRLWFGYAERGQGVTMFDGQNWTTYTTANGLADDHVYAIAFAPDGVAWLGTAAGVSRFDGQSWATYTAANGLLDDRVRAIAVGPDNRVWFGTANGVSRFDGQQWQSYTAADGMAAGPVNAIAIDSQGQVWVGAQPNIPGDGSGGISQFDGQRWINHPVQRSYTGNSFGLQGDWITAIALDANNQPWVTTLAHPLSKPLWVRGGLSNFNGQVWNNYSGDVELVSDYSTSVVIDASGAKWVGSSQGLFRFNGGPPPVRYTTPNGLLSEDVRGVALDQTGRIWAATWGGGVAVLEGDQWTTYITTGLADREVNAITIDRNGNPWFATPGGVSRFDGESWQVYTVADGLLDNQANAILADTEGNIWVGTGRGGYFGGGVNRFDGQRWTAFTTADGLPRNNISALALDSVGDIWAVSYTPGQYTALSSLSKFDGQKWVSPVEAGALADDTIYAFATDPLGRRWFGTDGSYESGPLVSFDGQQWRAYKLADGLAAQRVYALAIDSAGRKWLGTDKGVYVFDGQTWTNYTPTDGVAGNTVLAVAIETVTADFTGAWQSINRNFP